jgi:hypothetical protein
MENKKEEAKELVRALVVETALACIVICRQHETHSDYAHPEYGRHGCAEAIAGEIQRAFGIVIENEHQN